MTNFTGNRLITHLTYNQSVRFKSSVRSARIFFAVGSFVLLNKLGVPIRSTNENWIF